MDSEIRYENMAKILKALADHRRIRLLLALRDGEKKVYELSSEVGITSSNVSRHLNTLRLLGLVRCRREGNNSCYFTDFHEVFEIIDLTERIIRMLFLGSNSQGRSY